MLITLQSAEEELTRRFQTTFNKSNFFIGILEKNFKIWKVKIARQTIVCILSDDTQKLIFLYIV